MSNQASDAVHLLPMALIADAGYCSAANLEVCEQQGLEAYTSTSRQQHGHSPRPSRGRAPRSLSYRPLINHLDQGNSIGTRYIISLQKENSIAFRLIPQLRIIERNERTGESCNGKGASAVGSPS